MTAPTLDQLRPHFPRWEVVKDVIDNCLDVMLNWRQSGHPGGSRSKVYPLVATLLSGVMRWDIRNPEKRFADRFVLVGGHTNPLIYATLAVLNESLRVMHERTGDARYLVPDADEKQLTWEDLLTLRTHGGLPGHAEMEGKTLFFKFNTGPSGHGSPAAAGEAFALKYAGADEVKVFAFEGEGGLTPGASHETKNSAWGLGLGNLVYVVDWNDFGIDNQPISTVVKGTPTDWFEPYGWRVRGVEEQEAWEPVASALLEIACPAEKAGTPGVVWCRSRKGRGYYVYDNKSHGVPHKRNDEKFWRTKKDFATKYGVELVGVDEPDPGPDGALAQARENLNRILDVLRNDEELVAYVANTLVEIGDSVPESLPDVWFDTETDPAADPVLLDPARYPESMWQAPGSKAPNRKALSTWGAWVNAHCAEKYGRPLFLACSADLADSTNISGFAKPWDGFDGYGVYERDSNLRGSLLPQEITEFANAGMMAGLACVNLAEKPYERFSGFFGACSTYGSFSYLKYGLMRLFSQIAQDSQIRVGRVLWIAGHSGPETAEDSRTHFGIFAPTVTQLFPRGHVCNLYPWEYNEVPVLLAAALRSEIPIIALHLTRPPIEIPDREKLGMPSHFEAARGAYVMRDYDPDRPREGCVIVQGTSTTANLLKVWDRLPNVKIVQAASPELFQRQDEAYRNSVLSARDRADSTVATNASRISMQDWLFHEVAREYALSSDWDDRWRTGGTVDEICEEAHISPERLLEGIERFARDRAARLKRLREAAAG
jgi:transketolase